VTSDKKQLQLCAAEQLQLCAAAVFWRHGEEAASARVWDRNGQVATF
jgi:hypothetical protein